MARPLVPIDLNEVEHLAGLGLTEAEIAAVIGINIATITRRKHRQVELNEALVRGRARANRDVANACYKAAIGGNIAAIIWWEKTRRGLTDRLEISASVSKPIIASDSLHPLAGFAAGPITDSSRLLESNGAGSWETVGEDGSWSSDGGDDGARE